MQEIKRFRWRLVPATAAFLMRCVLLVAPAAAMWDFRRLFGSTVACYAIAAPLCLVLAWVHMKGRWLYAAILALAVSGLIWLGDYLLD
jgi:hypothetical protein